MELLLPPHWAAVSVTCQSHLLDTVLPLNVHTFSSLCNQIFFAYPQNDSNLINKQVFSES